MELTDKQWEIIAPLLPKPRSGPGKKGRPQRNNREVLEGILWILRTDARRKDLPKEFPPHHTCHRRFSEWFEDRTLERLLKAIAKNLHDRVRIDLSETFIDGSFASAKKGVLELVRQSAEKGPRSWQLRSALVFLSPYELQALRRMK